MVPRADGKLNYDTYGQGMQLEGDVSIAGFFPLHYSSDTDGIMPGLDGCNE